jgi:hypothetical protein
MTIGRNLGFRTEDFQRQCLDYRGRREWRAGENRVFRCINMATKENVEMFDVKAFKNGNLHLRLNQDFILALNVEHGRLKGWLRTAQEAAEELKDPKAAKYFNSTLKLGGSPTLLLT